MKRNLQGFASKDNGTQKPFVSAVPAASPQIKLSYSGAINETPQHTTITTLLWQDQLSGPASAAELEPRSGADREVKEVCRAQSAMHADVCVPNSIMCVGKKKRRK